ncbi:MAG: hypothetical protein E7391_06045 [Ruminococcaceae bacterium]|nr:hypothetical protein [Oscillospiraceae bacterium]
MNIKKTNYLVKIFTLILSICICFCFSACNNDDDYETYEKEEKQVEKSSEKKEKNAEKQAEKDEDVNIVVFEADTQESVTDKELESVQSLMRTRLDFMGYYDAKVTLNNKQIEVTVPKDIVTQSIIDILITKANVEFKDKDDNVIIDSNDVCDALPQLDHLSEYNDASYYISLTLTDEGRKKFADATEKISQYENGENYISICIDGQVVSVPSVLERIDSSQCHITGGFDYISARNLSAQIKSGALPFDLKVIEVK